MDGVGDVYNYIRRDGDWDNVYNNMKVLNNEPTINLAVGITVQSHNIFHMPEFYKFWKESPVFLQFITANILQTPKYLRPNLWPDEYRELIIKKLEEAEQEFPAMKKFITYMKSNDTVIRDYAKMRKYTRDIEGRYKLDIDLKSLVRSHLGVKLEGMDIVNERIINEKR